MIVENRIYADFIELTEVEERALELSRADPDWEYVEIDDVVKKFTQLSPTEQNLCFKRLELSLIENA